MFLTNPAAAARTKQQPSTGPTAVSLKPSVFLETIIAFLMPYFLNSAADIAEARNEIIDTLASYGTRTRAEFLQAAQIIALSMTTLDVLHEAKTVEMSMSMRIRFRGCANGLNRSTVQMQKSLDKNLACDGPMAPEPAKDLPDAEVQGAVEHARAAIETNRDRLPATGARPATLEEHNKQVWASAMMDTLKQMGFPVQLAAGATQT
jgi:hypothetical protein